MSGLRNLAVIAVLAALVAFAPAGGNALDTVFVALSMAFLGVIAWSLAQFAHRNELVLAALSDRDRGLLYGAAGVVVLLLVGTDRFFASGPGTVAWLALMAGSLYVAWQVWRAANIY